MPGTATATYVLRLLSGQFLLLAWLADLSLLAFSLTLPKQPLSVIAVVYSSPGIALLCIDTVKIQPYWDTVKACT